MARSPPRKMSQCPISGPAEAVGAEGRQQRGPCPRCLMQGGRLPFFQEQLPWEAAQAALPFLLKW